MSRQLVESIIGLLHYFWIFKTLFTAEELFWISRSEKLQKIHATIQILLTHDFMTKECEFDTWQRNMV